MTDPEPDPAPKDQPHLHIGQQEDPVENLTEQQLRDPYGTEDGDTLWFVRDEQTPTRTAAKKRAMSECDWDEFIRIRVRQCHVRFVWDAWEYGYSWCIKECEASVEGAYRAWRLDYAPDPYTARLRAERQKMREKA